MPTMLANLQCNSCIFAFEYIFFLLSSNIFCFCKNLHMHTYLYTQISIYLFFRKLLMLFTHSSMLSSACSTHLPPFVLFLAPNRLKYEKCNKHNKHHTIALLLLVFLVSYAYLFFGLSQFYYFVVICCFGLLCRCCPNVLRTYKHKNRSALL